MPQSSTPLASGQINGQDEISIDLVEPSNSLPAAIVIRWPAKPTVVPPVRFDAVVATVMRILANGVIELAALRVWRKL